MKIHGLQKMTLLDFPGQVACTVFLGGCEFRCPFCHNADLLDMNAPAIMEDDKLLMFLQGRKGLLDGVAITGGEPMLRKDLPDFLRKIRELGYKIKIDTNGNHPEMLKSIVGEGLADYIAMDMSYEKPFKSEIITLRGLLYITSGTCLFLVLPQLSLNHVAKNLLETYQLSNASVRFTNVGFNPIRFTT